MLAQFEMDDSWHEALDDDVPAPLDTVMRELFDAYRRADIEWILEHTDPDIEIAQPPELPGGNSYSGRGGLLDALLDWPRQWEQFRIEPQRIFAVGDDHIAIVAIHRVKARQIEIEVAAEIIWLMRWTGRCLSQWDMFMSVEAACEAARGRQRAAAM